MLATELRVASASLVSDTSFRVHNLLGQPCTSNLGCIPSLSRELSGFVPAFSLFHDAARCRGSRRPLGVPKDGQNDVTSATDPSSDDHAWLNFSRKRVHRRFVLGISSCPVLVIISPDSVTGITAQICCRKPETVSVWPIHFASRTPMAEPCLGHRSTRRCGMRTGGRGQFTNRAGADKT
jgi:hypothetical protein